MWAPRRFGPATRRARPDPIGAPAPASRRGSFLRLLQPSAGNRAVARLLRGRGPDAEIADAVSRPGHPLDPDMRSAMEARIGFDLGGVRLHDDPVARRAAEAAGARALTTGDHIVLGRGTSDRDEALLGHELRHVAQQRTGRAKALRGRGGDPAAREALEAEASSGAPVPAGPASQAAAEPVAVQLQRATAPAKPPDDELEKLPAWVPQDLKDDIRDGIYEPGSYLLPYTWPGGYEGYLILHIGAPGYPGQYIRLYRLYPDDIEWWRKYTVNEHAAEVLARHNQMFNRDMWRFVSVLGYPPEYAEAEINYINEQVLKAQAGAFGTVLAMGSATMSIGRAATAAKPPAGQRIQPGEQIERMRKRYADALAAGPPSRHAVAGGAAPGGAPAAKGPTVWQQVKSRVSGWFYKPTETMAPLPPALGGSTSKYGDIVVNSRQPPHKIMEALYHERVHSALSPKLLPLRDLRANVMTALYKGSHLMRWLEEAIAQTIALFRMRGISFSNLAEGMAFPLRPGYNLVVSRVVAEGAVGSITYAGVTYYIYVTTEDEVQGMLESAFGTVHETTPPPGEE